MTRPQRVKRAKRLELTLSAEEWEAVSVGAAQARMSMASFVRTLALGHEPRSTLDIDAVRMLAKIAGDQGRLGGLLKLWLSERAGDGAREFDVARVLRQIESLTPLLRAAAAKL